MKTNKQELGELGERMVARYCNCPRCKRLRTLRRLPNNFKCADVICDFCGYVAQVKTIRTPYVEKLPKRVLGAAWGPQRQRMQAGVFLPLFVVLTNGRPSQSSIHYLSADLQLPKMFTSRKKLSANAKRAGWQGFLYHLDLVRDRIVRVI
jgi:type II restriction enzyme